MPSEPTQIKSYEEIVEINRPNEKSENTKQADEKTDIQKDVQLGVLGDGPEGEWRPTEKGHWEPVKGTETDQ